MFLFNLTTIQINNKYMILKIQDTIRNKSNLYYLKTFVERFDY